mgnify:CR=1 FL=1
MSDDKHSSVLYDVCMNECWLKIYFIDNLCLCVLL